MSPGVYEAAYLCGGPHRVALAAVAAMAHDGRISISRTRHRVKAVHRRAGHPVEQAVLDALPEAGQVLGPLLQEVADSAAVAAVRDGLRDRGLAGHHSLAGHPHLSAAGRDARRELEDAGPALPGEQRVAVLGVPAITDPGLRGIFTAPDPPPGGKLVPKAPKTGAPGRYPSDPDLTMHPGISGRW